MKVFVTGATGFVGPHLIAHLLELDDEVVDPGDANGGFDVTDRDAVHEQLKQASPEVVYHLAARSEVVDSWRDPIASLRVNVEGTQNVLDAARDCGVRRVLVVGSAEEYGAASEPLREDAPLRPKTPYGASKASASFIALQTYLSGGPETIRVRPFSHTGPGQSARFLIPALAKRIAEAEQSGTETIAIGNTEPVRDISDVRDVVRAYRSLMQHGTPGEVYNVCRGEGVTVGEIATRLAGRSSRALSITSDPELVRPVEVSYLVGDPGKLQRLTRWKPHYSLDETLDAVLEEARARAQGS